MKDIIIVGAGGFGREAYYIIKAINAVSPRWNIKGFINDIPVDLRAKKIDVPILGTIKDWHPSKNEVFAMGISSPAGKEKVAKMLKERGAIFETLIHPDAQFNGPVEIGEGCVVGGSSIFCDCVVLGDFVHVAGSTIGQDASIGDFSTTTAYTNIATRQVGRSVFVGSHAVVLKDVGDFAMISVGSIVLRKVKPFERIIGNPGRVIGRTDQRL